MTSKSTAVEPHTHTHSHTHSHMEAHWQAVRRTRPLGQAGCPGRAKHTPSQAGLLISGLQVKVQARTIIAVQICTANAIGNGIIPASLMGPAVDAASANQRWRLGPFCAVIFAQGCGISLATCTRLEPAALVSKRCTRYYSHTTLFRV